MMRKNNNRNNMKHRNNGGGRRFQGGGNRNHNDGQNIARQKHHATQQLGKYSDLARNAQINGDRVDVEYYLQHVEHYTRVLADIAVIEAERHAHFREQNLPAAGAQDEQNAVPAEEGDVAEVNAAPAEPAPAGDVQQQAPRPQRGPRPQRAPRPQAQASDNGAAEANSNTTEIPLPGSILPPV